MCLAQILLFMLISDPLHRAGAKGSKAALKSKIASAAGSSRVEDDDIEMRDADYHSDSEDAEVEKEKNCDGDNQCDDEDDEEEEEDSVNPS